MRSLLFTLMTAALFGSFVAPAIAQEATGAAPIDPQDVKSEFRFTFEGGYVYGFETDLEDGGNVQNSRLDVGAKLGWQLSDDLNMTLGFNYVLDSYDFSTPNSLAAAEPWSDINQIGFGAVFTYDIVSDWAIFAGPVFQFSYENGAQWDNCFTAGGLIGVTYTASKDLVLGGGLAIISQIEDDLRFIPIIIINWNIVDNLTLTSKTSGAFGGAAVELVWTLDPWEFAMGGVHKYSRFRLDDDAVAPDGVGQEDSIPLYARVGYHFNEQFSVDLIGGATCFGNLRLEDSGGHKINDQDFDPALFVGAYLKVQF